MTPTINATDSVPLLDASPAGEPVRSHGIQRILVCLDRSPSSDLCLAHAMAFASTFGSSLTLLHVMQPPSEHVGPQTTDALGWELARQEASAHLEQYEKRAAASGRRVDVRLEEGRAAERIVALAREVGADLVVLGSHAKDGEAVWHQGAIAQAVLAMARSSLLVAVARGSTVNQGTAPLGRILVPLDGSLRTESVLPIAERLAQTHRSELLLVHVVAEPRLTGVLIEPEDLQLANQLATRLEARASRYLETLRDKLERQGLAVRTLVARRADKRHFLTELSVAERIDLVVLSAHGSTCTAARPFGSVTAHLLTHSMIPLLVLQDLAGTELRHDGITDEQLAPPLRASFPPEGA